MDNYLMGREKNYPLSEILLNNALDLIERLKSLELEFGRPLYITSGYRPPAINQHVPGAVRGDAHERCQGVDLRDQDLELSDFILSDVSILERLELWMESPQSAKDHVHLQTYPPRSGHRVFIA